MASVPPTQGSTPKEEVKTGMALAWSGFRKFWKDLINLQKGLDREGTIINIRNNMRMQGANAWTLMCSIMIASLGLDLNSPAVIIGAMLISPLMAPILGVGLSIGINDTKSLNISFQHFGVSIAIALVTSTLYFLFTPFGDFTSQIENRTAPTLLDAAVALFGGIAGIISGSQKDKSNAIPGVAIATALMPPLCVSGFGLANIIKSGWNTETFGNITQLNNLEITLNSFYLFFLNATLVALATFVIVRMMKFPLRSYTNASDARKKNLIILVISILIIIPSLFIFQKVIKQAATSNNIKTVLAECFGAESQFIDDWKIVPADSTNSLFIKIYSPKLSRELDDYQQELAEKLPDLNVVLYPSSEVDWDNFEKVALQASEVERLDSLVQNITQQKEIKKSAEILKLEQRLDSMFQDTSLMNAVSKEIEVVFSDNIKKARYYHPSQVSRNPPMITLQWKTGRFRAIQNKIKEFVKTRAKVEEVVVANE